MIRVLKSGFYSSIQDQGRNGFQEFGVPKSGSMDSYSSALANSIIGNDNSCAVLEITMTGPTLEFLCNTVICITGAYMSPSVNNLPVKLNQAINVKANDILDFGKLLYGFRAYLAVKNGFKTKLVMNSRSMFKNITANHIVIKGDHLEIEENISISSTKSSIKVDSHHFSSIDLEVFKGPEYDKLSIDQQNLLTNNSYSISKNHNRMAYQLEEILVNKIKPIITSLVMPGTVQLTPSGKLILLMRDCQTSGGYPRVLQLGEKAINMLAQKTTGNQIKFRLTE